MSKPSYKELVDENSYLKGELHALVSPLAGYIAAFQALDDLQQKVHSQQTGNKKHWWSDRLSKISVLFQHWDKLNGEKNRLQIALDQSRRDVDLLLARIKELEAETEQLKEQLMDNLK